VGHGVWARLLLSINPDQMGKPRRRRKESPLPLITLFYVIQEGSNCRSFPKYELF
jgi:hypothetical protein